MSRNVPLDTPSRHLGHPKEAFVSRRVHGILVRRLSVRGLTVWLETHPCSQVECNEQSGATGECGAVQRPSAPQCWLKQSASSSQAALKAHSATQAPSVQMGPCLQVRTPKVVKLGSSHSWPSSPIRLVSDEGPCSQVPVGGSRRATSTFPV